jgi:hypothetical protein
MAQYHLNNIPEDTLRKGRARAAIMGISFREMVIMAIERFSDPESVTDAWFGKVGFPATQVDQIKEQKAIEFALGIRK